MQELAVSRVAPDIEVKTLMDLLSASAKGEMKTLMNNEHTSGITGG